MDWIDQFYSLDPAVYYRVLDYCCDALGIRKMVILIPGLRFKGYQNVNIRIGKMGMVTRRVLKGGGGDHV